MKSMLINGCGVDKSGENLIYKGLFIWPGCKAPHFLTELNITQQIADAW